MNYLIIALLLLSFLVVTLFTLAICKSAGMADRQLDQMRSSVIEPKFSKVPAGIGKKESMDPLAEKTRRIFSPSALIFRATDSKKIKNRGMTQKSRESSL